MPPAPPCALSRCAVLSRCEVASRRPRCRWRCEAALTRRTQHDVTPPALSRGALLRLAAASLALRARAAVASLLPAPPVGDCTDCIGALDCALNACPLSSVSCVSAYSDDEAHFAPPWLVPDGPREAAIAELIRVATGGEYQAGFTAQPFGRERTEVAAFIVATTAAFVARQKLPPKPPLARAGVGEKRVFDGRVDAQTSDYLRIVFGEAAAAASDGASPVYDAEFSFPPADELCNVRFASRARDGAGEKAQLALSFTRGFAVDQNGARLLAEDLRKALRWDLAVVITGFDPRYNNDEELIIERPFNALRAASRAAKGEPARDDGF